MAVVLGALIVFSTAAALAGHQWTRPRARPRTTLLRHPGFWLLIVTGAIYVNQVLCTVYLMRVWHGDPEFIARFLPSGWFALADDNPAIRWLAGVWPHPELLSWTLLRVQAFLELPFVLLAYATICRWAGTEVLQRLAVWPAAVSYTATFCLIEWSLANPYTVDDIVIRIVSGLVTPWLITSLAAGRRERLGSAPDLVVFVMSAGALGVLVLAVYDTALLYNLGHLAAWVPTIAGAVAVLFAARLIGGRLPLRQAGPGIATVAGALGWFLVFFFAPALPIRYGLSFGSPVLSAVAGLIIVAAAIGCGVHSAAGTGVARRVWAAELATAVVLGAVAACAGYFVTGGYPEARLLAAAGAFFVLVIAVCALIDRRIAA